MEAIHKTPHNLTARILLGMAAGALVGLLFNLAPIPEAIEKALIQQIADGLGTLFMNAIRMLVVPVVLFSLVYGTASLGNQTQLGRLAGKSIALFLTTTLIAISLGLIFSILLGVGKGANFELISEYTPQIGQSFKDTITNIIPTNPFEALVNGDMLQIIFIAIFLGITLSALGKKVQPIIDSVHYINNAIMKMVLVVMDFAPYGLFCLMAVTFAQMGIGILVQLLAYISTVLGVLLVHTIFTYGGLLKLLGKLPVGVFYKKVRTAAVFAFATSSSNAAIPLMLDTTERKLGVKNSTASFTIPLGATVNMDGTAIMQGVAVVFIANIYNIDLSLMEYIIILGSALLASIGTAGAPSSGILVLALILQQVGLPLEGIALILGVDRLVDMARTCVNVIGNCAITTLIAQSEGTLNEKKYKNPKFKDVKL